MDDLISRQDAIDAVSRGCQELRGIFAECEKNLNKLPSAQTEIIRCKDCRWALLAPQRKTATCMKKSLPFTHAYDWYCADGEVATVKNGANKDSGDVKDGRMLRNVQTES